MSLNDGKERNMGVEVKNRGYAVSAECHEMVKAESALTGYSINKTIEMMLAEAADLRKTTRIITGHFK